MLYNKIPTNLIDKIKRRKEEKRTSLIFKVTKRRKKGNFWRIKTINKLFIDINFNLFKNHKWKGGKISLIIINTNKTVGKEKKSNKIITKAEILWIKKYLIHISDENFLYLSKHKNNKLIKLNTNLKYNSNHLWETTITNKDNR